MAKFVTTIAGRMIWNLITAVVGVVRAQNQLYTPIMMVRTTEVISVVLLLLSLESRVQEQSPSQAWVCLAEEETSTL